MSYSITDAKTAAPNSIYLSDYQVPVYQINEIDLVVSLEEAETIIKSHMRVQRNPLSSNEQHEFILNGEALTLLSIQVDGNELSQQSYQLNDDLLIIHQVPDQFELEMTTKIYPQANKVLSGLYRSRNTYCTQCEAEGFRRITYFPDRPDILARYTTTIIADAKQYPYLLSNGNLVETGELSKGKHYAKWEDPFKKPSYLFALVAGDFDVIEDTFVTQSGRAINLKFYVETGYKDQVRHAVYSLKQAMRWDELQYGREYDLDVYMVVAISDFNMGAMENKGLNIFNTKYVLAKPETATDEDFMHVLSVIGHEYFHNWSGNRVTCRDWFQLSLKEGLTIFRDQSFTEDMLSRPVMRIRDVVRLREAQFPEDAGPLAHPVYPDSYIEINNFYTATIYEKGAEVLRMLRTILGDAEFSQGMDLYFTRFDGEAVTIEDFVQTMEVVSGIDLGQFRRWYKQSGTPDVTVTDTYNARLRTYTLNFHQSTPPTPDQPVKTALFIPIKMGLLNQQGDAMPLQFGNEAPIVETVLHLTEETQSFTIKNVTTKPIPSLLRHFSAPIKLHYDYTDADLLLLAKHDKDEFNQWEACQRLLLKQLLQLIDAYQHGKALVLPEILIDLFTYILQQLGHDQFFQAEMLLLPSEKLISEQMPVIDVDAIHAAREFVMQSLANELTPLLLNLYRDNHDESAPYEFNVKAIGRRKLKNACLAYLGLLPAHRDLAIQQFDVALTKNMTDAFPALAVLANLESVERGAALEQFYTIWQADALVIDKWLAVQAATKLPNALQQVKSLLRHPAFDLKNPNKVYALIGTFTQRNPVHFHAKNGEGYAFLRETVEAIDKFNPQVAARLVNPLTTWRRYDKERQRLMRNQLDLLLQDNKLSNDLYELVSKSIKA
ncbi:MAG: aminopeptidase N [Gammaproteobacteria bacterium RIFCSPHIGHO2_12_FULL_43_28]|nr:MAG: aminopeptidase N [Gammaproteobacteria bacterium RIFCSPHIGHO2_12_FULL_43_28]